MVQCFGVIKCSFSEPARGVGKHNSNPRLQQLVCGLGLDHRRQLRHRLTKARGRNKSPRAPGGKVGAVGRWTRLLQGFRRGATCSVGLLPANDFYSPFWGVFLLPYAKVRNYVIRGCGGRRSHMHKSPITRIIFLQGFIELLRKHGLLSWPLSPLRDEHPENVYGRDTV